MPTGGCWFPLNPKSGDGELAYILGQTRPRLVLHEPAVAGHLPPAQADGVYVVVPDEVAFLHQVFALADGHTVDRSGGAANRDAEIVYTSGSTGKPKGVVLSHRSLLADAFALGQWFGFTEEDWFLTVCPLFHNSGQIFTTLTPLWCGAVTTSVRSEVGMLRVWHFVDRFEVRWSLVVNAYLGLSVSRPGRSAKGTLRGVLSGGSRLSPDLIDAFESTFGTRVYQVFGLTETIRVDL